MERAKKIKEYVTEQMISELKDCEHTQDVDLSATMWLEFGTYVMSMYRVYTHKSKRKIVNDWRNKTANVINQELNYGFWDDV